MADLWIIIPGWDRFQHYKDRDPGWVKAYTSLLHKDEYLQLTGHQRGILHGLWLEYASAHCQLALDTASLTRRLALRVSSAQLEALANAGFIEFSSSPDKTVVLRTTREEEQQTVSADQSPVDNHVVEKLAGEIRDANDMTLHILKNLEPKLPDVAFARALESLKHRRDRKPPLTSEARYVVAALKKMQT